MTKRLVAIVGVLSALVGGSAHGQYASVEEDRAAKQASQEQTAEAERQKYVGRKFWIEPNPKAISRLEFIATIDEYSYQDTKFVVTEPTSFVVSGFKRERYENYVEVTFEDGKIAYLKENSIFHLEPLQYALFDEIYSLKEPKIE
jgi:type II secretory pathway pseudopilin PulG